MTETDFLPKALFGGALSGTRLMRFVFMDEAGTSASRDEKLRLVAAIIVHADKQMVQAEVALSEALQAVPKDFRDGFVFHAEEIMNNDKYRDRWRLTDRVNFLCSVMRIPSRLGLPRTFFFVRTDAAQTKLGEVWNLKLHEDQHVMAFLNCVGLADRWIRENASFDEIGMIVAENHDLKRYLNQIPSMLRDHPHVMSDGGLAWTDEDIERGYCAQSGVMSVSRIRRTVHFVGKSEDNLVWLADACAYGLKRFFSGAQWGEQFGRALGTDCIHMPNFTRSVSSGGTIVSPFRTDQ